MRIFVVALVTALACATRAQDELQRSLDEIKGQLEGLRQSRQIVIDESALGVTPGVISGLGQIVFAGSYQGRTRFTDRPDGGFSSNVYLGNPDRLLFEGLISYNDVSDPLTRGSLGVRAGRMFGNTYLSVGVDNVYVWGGTDAHRGVSVRASTTLTTHPDIGKPFSRLYLSLGAGNGRYAPEGQLNRVDPRTGAKAPNLSAWGFFGGIGFSIGPVTTGYARYTNHDWTVGFTFRPWPNESIFISPALADVTGQAGDGRRFILSIGFAVPLRKS